MRKTENSAAGDDCPTAFLVAWPIVELHPKLLLLAEVKCFTWMNFIADTLNEVLVRDLPILVSIKPVKDDLLLILGHRETPMR